MSRRAGNKRAEQKVIYLGTQQRCNFIQSKSENSRLNIVSCSGIYPLKRLDLIIGALAQIQKDIYCSWVHFGSGPDYDRICDLARTNLSTSNVSFEFKGQLPNAEILNFYEENSVDLFINTSDFEGVPVSIMEAMSFGIPCVARNVGGNSEIIKNAVSGTLISGNATLTDIAMACKDFYLLKQCRPEAFHALRQSTYNFWFSNFNADKNYSAFSNYILN
jgi:glycosyltransferase involved in cell wall biosynthesis